MYFYDRNVIIFFSTKAFGKELVIVRLNCFAFKYVLLSAVALTHRDNDNASHLLSTLVKKGGGE